MTVETSTDAACCKPQCRQANQRHSHEHAVSKVETSDALQRILEEREECVIRKHSATVPKLRSECSSVVQRMHEFLEKEPTMIVRGLVFSLSMDSQGCRLLQAALEFCNSSQRKDLAVELRGHVRTACESPHANYVMQRFIELLPPAALDFVLPELSSTWSSAEMARHRFGCRVLERLVEHFTACSPACEDLTRFLDVGVLRETRALCYHCYGNFVMQHLLEHGSLAQQQVILNSLRVDIREAVWHEHAGLVLSTALSYVPRDEQRNLAADIFLVGDLANLRNLHPTLPFSKGVVIERLLSVFAGPAQAELRRKLHVRKQKR